MAQVAISGPVPLWRLFLRMGGWFAVLFAVISLVLALISSNRSAIGQRFEAEAREAEAVITERFTTTSRDSDGKRTTYYNFRLRFATSDGASVTTRRRVSRNIYNSVREGDSLPVWYLPDRPGDVALSRDEKTSEAFTLQLFSLFFGVLALGGLWYSGGHAVAAVRARRHGKREVAAVTGIKRTNTRINKKYRYRLTWREADGREGESLMYPREAIEGIPEGSEITVYQGLKRAWWAGDVGERPGTD